MRKIRLSGNYCLIWWKICWEMW